MNKTLIFRKIGGIISEITEQYQYLSEDPENINPLELELFIANSHFLSEHLAILKKLEASAEPAQISKSKISEQIQPISTNTPGLPSTTEDHSDSVALEPAVFNQVDEIRGIPVEIKEETWFEPVAEPHTSYSTAGIDEEIPKTLAKNETPANFSTILETPEPERPEPSHFEIKPAMQSESTAEMKFEKEELLRAEVIKEVEPIKLTANEMPLEPVKMEEPLRESFSEKDSSYQHEMGNNSSTAERVPTLNEILSAGKSKEKVMPNLGIREDRDLKSMIKLNDKLMFVRDLFNGYSLAYSEAIDLVNRFDNFESADHFLKQNYADKNRWSEKQSSVDQFYEILNRRFS